MLVRRLNFRQPGRTALVALALAGCWPARTAAEPIRFSSRPGPATTQEFVRREPLLPTEASADGKSRLQPELPLNTFMPPGQTMTPTTGLTRRQMEAQDQKRNWLMQSPETILKQAERQDEANRDPFSRDDTAKSSMTRFLEKPDASAEQGPKLRNDLPSEKARRDRSQSGQDTSRDPQETGLAGRSGEARNAFDTRQVGTSPGAEGPSLFTAGAARTGSFGRMVSEAKERERQRENAASLESFQRSFNNPWAQPAPSSAGNPLAGALGGPPSTAGGFTPTDLMRRNTAANLGPAARGPLNLGTGGGQESFDPKNPLNYGSADTVMQPASAARPALAPIKLDAPRRKF